MNKDSSRLKEIISIINENNVIKDRNPYNIRKTIEDLGPTFIKMGQILSNRDDLIDKKYCDELKNLKGNVQAMPFDKVETILNNLYGDYNEVFSYFEKEPIGAASIAQTHKAILKDNTIVAVKIQRENIYEIMTQDCRLIKKAISLLNLDKLINIVNINSLIDEMYELSLEEMDFLEEAKHIEEFKNNNNDVHYIKPLNVYKDYSSKNILVMDFIDAPFINEMDKLKNLGYDMDEISSKLADNYIKQAIDDGFYHADPHADNIKIENGKIVYLDFGMMGRITSRNKALLDDCIKAIIKNDVTTLAHDLEVLNISGITPDHMKLSSDIKLLLDRFKTTSIQDINVIDFGNQLFKLLKSNNIKLPKDISMLLRGILVLEGLLEEISPNTNLMKVLKSRVKVTDIFTRDNIEKTIVRGIENSSDLISLPSESLNLLKGINSGEVKFNIEMTDSKNQMNKFESIINEGIITILDVGVLIGIALMSALNDSLPITYYIYCVLALVFTLYIFIKMVKSKFNRK